MSAETNLLAEILPENQSGAQSLPVLGVTRKQGEQEQVPIAPNLPILPVRSLVVFPGTVVPLTVGRDSSRKLLDETLPRDKVIGIVMQRRPDVEAPDMDELHAVGVAAVVLKLIRPSPENVMIVVHALRRIRLKNLTQSAPYLRADVDVLQEVSPPPDAPEWKAAVNHMRDTARQLLEMMPSVPGEAQPLLASIEDPGILADFLASNLTMEPAQKQDLLEEPDVRKRVSAVQLRLSAQLEIARLQQKIQQDVASQFSDAQRRAYLREQLKAIQRELGEEATGPDEQVEVLRRRLLDGNAPPAVMEQAEKELKRLYSIPSASPEHAVIAGYVETLADLPWNLSSPDNFDLDQARRILDRDHFDLEKVKRRLIEYLAVRKLNPEGRGPILCFLGPPGVGKTSLGQSIADALGRKFARMSLGGIRDEAEIRGHRRTYIGSMPGRIIQELRRLQVRNPVLMLDEVDKIGADFRGDPASALLEVLDPRQNDTFVDRYVDVAFDLSQVIFIATANYMDPVPPALRDRMEILEIPGYTETEKLQIATRYLVPRQLRENGLNEALCRFEEEALRRIILEYTHEAGVRDLERQIGAVCRAAAAKVAAGRQEPTVVTPADLPELLGPARFVREMRLKTGKAGVVTGLAFTPTGGEILHVEAIRFPGQGKLQLTGHIGQVMKESAEAALSLVRSRQAELGIPPRAFSKYDIHVHVPSGAVPKDGPSAGVAMFTALASLFTDKPVRPDVAMTGEISLRGLVLPIGGLKEKSLAAVRAGIPRIIIPKLNQKDLVDLPAEVKDKVRFIPTENVDDVLEAALAKPEVKTPSPTSPRRRRHAPIRPTTRRTVPVH